MHDSAYRERLYTLDLGGGDRHNAEGGGANPLGSSTWEIAGEGRKSLWELRWSGADDLGNAEPATDVAAPAPEWSAQRVRSWRPMRVVPVLVAVLLSASMACAATLESRAVGAPRVRPVFTGRAFTVYLGPIPSTLLSRAMAWWNSAGANVELVLARRSSSADIVIEPYRALSGTVIGVTDNSCAIEPCRPEGQETITLSTATDYNRLTTLVHELGHALGLGHSHVHTCSVMAPEQGEGCPSDQLPVVVPPVDRRALIKIWGPRS